jgi:hypothetical protein
MPKRKDDGEDYLEGAVMRSDVYELNERRKKNKVYIMNSNFFGLEEK